MRELIKSIFPFYQKLRHNIHAHPELAYEEIYTANLVAEELKRLNVDVQTGIGKTGVIGILDSGKPGKTIALRADMDALPILEDTSLEYQSKIQGKMHACGHDGHTASLLATANVLSQMKDQLSGKVKFIFQPAEEGQAGAKAMIDDGVLENPTVDVIFGFHNYPGIPLGLVSVKSGCTMYSNTTITILIHGKGGHAAQPETAINPIEVGSQIIQRIKDLDEELRCAAERTVVSMTQFISGTASNVIPETATIIGTIRTASIEQSNRIEKILIHIIKEIELKFSVSIVINFEKKYPPTINTLYESEFVLEQAKLLFGNERVEVKSRSSRASEDFSFYLQKVPGCYFFIGNGENAPFCHSPHYNFDDQIIPVAVELMATIVMRY